MGQSPLTDESLVAQVAAGGSDALMLLYERYSQQVFSMAVGMVRDYKLAEDVTQEVFVALWTRASTFDVGRGVFRHWFLHLAHNRVIDELRRRRRLSLHDADREPEDPALGLEAPGDTAEAAVNAVLMGQVKEALLQLPPEQRKAVALAYLGGATQREIADQTGVPLGTVKTRLRLGIMKLRQLLQEPAASADAGPAAQGGSG